MTVTNRQGTTIHADGDVVGERYKILAPVGSGGMQEVYLAIDETLDRKVALKVPKNASAARSFKRSAELSAKVNHPNVAKTLDYVDDRNRSYLIEEYVGGQDLRKLRARLKIFDPYLVAQVMHNLARAVGASHHAGVIHRDLKPGNIMLSPGTSFETIKVTDFGIAKMAQEEFRSSVEDGDEQTLTNSQTAIGALPYMSPEMIRKASKSEKPTDLWAIGAICFELLTGVKPFGSGFNAIPKILEAKLPPLPASLRKPQFTSLLDALFELIGKCMTPEASDRISADNLSKACGQLCYARASRSEGRVTSLPFGPAAFGFISVVDSEDVFFHVESVYGQPISLGDEVCFTKHAGSPHARAHPVVKLA